MSRLRKASRLWRDPARVAAARRVFVPQDEAVFEMDPGVIFARQAPVEIEIGAGRGDFIIARAAAFPNRNFLAVELPGTVAQMLAARCGRAELNNLRVIRMDARSMVNLFIPDQSVAAYHIYFPDPWPKDRHAKHRLFNPDFVRNLARTLKSDATVAIASDVREWADRMFTAMERDGFRRTKDSAPGAAMTGFGRKYITEGRPIYSAVYELRRSNSQAD